jgi:hypothetical protein
MHGLFSDEFAMMTKALGRPQGAKPLHNVRQKTFKGLQIRRPTYIRPVGRPLRYDAGAQG